jgi:hypothetical protein
VGELRGGLDGLRSGEAAGVDEVVFDSESRIRGNGRRAGGEEAVEMGDRGESGRGEELGDNAASRRSMAVRRRRQGDFRWLCNSVSSAFLAGPELRAWNNGLLFCWAEPIVLTVTTR